MKNFWIKTIFWENIKRTCAILGGPTAAGLHVFQAGDLWVVVSAAISFLGAILAIWMVDADRDGVVDIFQDENKK